MLSTWSMRCLGFLGETSWSEIPSHVWDSLLLGNAALLSASCAVKDRLLGHIMGQTSWLAILSRFLIKADKGAGGAGEENSEGAIVLYRSIAGESSICTPLGKRPGQAWQKRAGRSFITSFTAISGLITSAIAGLTSLAS